MCICTYIGSFAQETYNFKEPTNRNRSTMWNTGLFSPFLFLNLLFICVLQKSTRFPTGDSDYGVSLFLFSLLLCVQLFCVFFDGNFQQAIQSMRYWFLFFCFHLFFCYSFFVGLHKPIRFYFRYVGFLLRSCLRPVGTVKYWFIFSFSF